MSATAAKTTISLKGSVDIVAEFFDYSINSILYQRGIYPPDQFKRVSKYGLTTLITENEGLKSYLSNVFTQLRDWLTNGAVQKLVVVITSVETGETLERWVFDVQTDKGIGPGGASDKPEKDIMQEIQAIIRQITASVTFLPLIDEPCSFDLLVYTDSDVDVPMAWEESDPKYISNPDQVQLRSFTTKVHKVDASVTYKSDV